jgi:hypothetical protein
MQRALATIACLLALVLVPAAVTAAPTLSSAAATASSLSACAWPVESTPTKANVFYPDANATYWTTPFVAARGLAITIKGAFPNARYFSVQVYNAAAQNYPTSTYGTSAISDYQLQPDAGSINPWVTSGAPGGGYTVTVSNTPPADATNVLPLPPPVRRTVGGIDGTVGFLMIRVYLPDGSPDNASVVPLPTVTFSGPRGRAVTLTPCASAQTAPSAASQIKKAAVKRVLNNALSGTNAAAAPPLCTQKQAGCAPALQFFKAGLKATPFPNASSKYVAALYERAAGYVTVVQALLPSSSTAAGDSPAPWSPTGPPNLRYWSICSYLHQPPYPVISSGSTNGCLADEQLDTAATNGIAYAVLSLPSDRPASTRTTGTPQVGWLPVSTNATDAAGLVAVRNMLPSASLPYDLGPTATSDPAAAQAAMGSYYPSVAQCTTTTFNAAANAAGGGQSGAIAGVRECFANPASPS